MPRGFERYIGIDYSGAKTPTSRLGGLAVYVAQPTLDPVAVTVPAPISVNRWCRTDVANWLRERLSEAIPTLVGIDHGFSFPLAYFQQHGLAHDWSAFLDDFHAHWPTDEAHTSVEFIRKGVEGNGAARTGQPGWLRVTEARTGMASSVFNFKAAQRNVAKSTHAGLPWLRVLKRQCTPTPHFWPFDGWEIPAGRSVVTEVYPSLWNRAFPRRGRTSHQHDAWCVAQALREADATGMLARWLNPDLEDLERHAADIEGWILGVR
jgi:hypothetical protein